DVARVARASRRAGPGGLGELLPLELPGQRVERPLEHLRDVARWHCVAEQRLHVPQLLVRLLIHGDLQRESTRRERTNTCARGKWLPVRCPAQRPGWDHSLWSELQRRCVNGLHA